MNFSQNLRSAVIGCGFIGCGRSLDPEKVGVLSHAHAYLSASRTDLIALCDTSSQRLLEVNADFPGIPTYTNVNKCLEQQRPELVSIATPDETHFGVAVDVCSCPSVAGVLLEKPLALSSAQAIEIIRIAEKNNVTIAVNYSRRYTRRFQYWAGQIRAGLLGKIQSIQGCYTKGILHNGSHWIDLLDLFGIEVDRVQAFHHIDVKDPDPTPSVRLEGSSCANAFLIGCDQRHFTVFEMDVIGTKGRLKFIDGGQRVEFLQPQPSTLYDGYIVLGQQKEVDDGGMKDAMSRAILDLIDCVENGKTPLSSGENAIRCISVGEAILDSLDRAVPVNIRNS